MRACKSRDVLMLLAVAGLVLGGCPEIKSQPVFLNEMEALVLAAVNQERLKAGLLPLERRKDLNGVAHDHTATMIARDQEGRPEPLAHEGEDAERVEKRFDRAGIKWQQAGENLARNRNMDDPVREAVAKWMASPGHRQNILDKRFTETGIGVAPSRQSGYYYFTQVFVLRLPE